MDNGEEKLPQKQSSKPEPTRKTAAVAEGSEFDILPDEIILHIFSMLPQKSLFSTALVSKRWRDITYSGELWDEIQMLERYVLDLRVVRPGALDDILARGTRSFYTTICYFKPPLLPAEIQGKVYRVESLDMCNAYISLADLRTLLKACPQLKYLAHCFYNLDNETCRIIGVLKNLETLKMNQTYEEVYRCSSKKHQQSSRFLFGLKAYRCTLKSSTWTRPAYRRAFSSHSHPIPKEIIDTLFAEVSSGIRRFDIALHSSALSDEHIQTLVQRCPGIVHLNISDAPLLTKKCLEYLKELKELKYLSLHKNFGIEMEAIGLSQQLKQLEELVWPE